MNTHSSKKAKALITLLIFAVLFTLASCGSDGVFFNENEEVEYRTGNIIYLPMEKVRTLNPMVSKDEDTYFISKLIYDSLFELDEMLEPKMKLVDSYIYSDDKLTLTINLKQGVKWHDGEEFTSSDVKFSIDNYTALSYGGETVYNGYTANIRNVGTVRGDPYKVIISFRSKANIGVENLVFPILPAHQFRRPADIKRDLEDFMPIGTGAYTVDSYNNLSHLILKANEDYFGGVPKNELHFVIFPQKSDALNLIGVGSISLLINSDMDRDTLTSNMKVNTVNFPSNQAEFIAFNMSNSVMRNKRVRQAIAYAVDSQEILENAYLNSGIISDTIYYPYYYGNPNEEELYPYDLDKAASMVAMAGYYDSDGDGFIDDRRGETITLRILVNSENIHRVAAAQIIKNELDKIALDSYIIYCDGDEYLSKIDSGEYDINIGGYSFNERYDLRDILHSGYYNKTGYANKELDSLLDEMQSCVTNTRKAEIFKEVNSILKDEIPYYCILYRTYGAISSSSLQGEVKPLFNDYYRNSMEWILKYEIPAAVAE